MAKNILKFIFFQIIIIAILFIPCLTFAQSSSQGLYIKSFDSRAKILDESWLEVDEYIEAVYQTPHHGIYRDIPYRYHDKYNQIRNIKIKVIQVVDQNDQSYKYSKSIDSGYLKLKIGDPDKLITGEYKYKITYRVWGALNYFGEEAELYWNITGDAWEIPIKTALGRVDINDDRCLDISGFSGSYGSKDNAKISPENKCSVAAESTLEPYQGLTLVAKWPKEMSPPPNTSTKIILWFLWNWVYIIPIIVFIITLLVFIRRGRDPVGRGTIVPEFESPGELTPIEIGALYDNKTQGRDFSAMIIDFAVRGFLEIKEVDKKGVFGKTDYQLIKIKEGAGFKDFERKVFDKLFESRKSIFISDLTDKFYTTKKEAEKMVFNDLVSNGYYLKSPLSAGVVNYIVGLILIFIGIFLGGMFENLGISFASSFASFVISGITVIIFGLFMSKRTKRGVLMYEKVMGFKLYLETAEKYRMHFAEEKKLFEQFLPYAMVFGITGIWAKKFKDIYKKGESPGWYSGYRGGYFVPYAFASSIDSSFSSAVNSSFTSTPSSSGSSGFGGGGFSGGGFGGGGGGGW